MKFEIFNDDPFNVLTSTKPAVENAKFVFIDESKVNETARIVSKQFEKGPSAEDMGFKALGDIGKNAQLVFLEDVVNFCFWAPKDGTKWAVTQPDGTATSGGWFGLKTCFDRALAEGVPILNAEYLSSIGTDDVRKFFRSANEVEIPLLDERVKNLREAGAVLSAKYDGKFIKVIEDVNYNAPALVKKIADTFSSFRDISKLDGADVCFFKRAQICCHDLNYVFAPSGKTVAGTETLTAFADYKVPQILRMYGVLNYGKDLAERVDHYVELAHDSREEIEIRAASVWAVELLRQQTPHLRAVDIDNALWLMSQNIQKVAKPYHRTRNIFY